MRPELFEFIHVNFPHGQPVYDQQIPHDYVVVYCPDHWVAKYALIQDCGEYARHICNHLFFDSAIAHARKRSKLNLLG